jgi:hypothetical protein
MDNNTSKLPALTELKNTFLTKNEKFWGNLTMIAFGLGGFLVLYTVMPFISNFLGMAIGIVGKTALLGTMLGLIGIAVVTVLDPRFQNWLWYKRAILYRKLTQRMVKNDPIGVARAYIVEFLQPKYDAVQSAYNVIMGNKQRVMAIIETKKEELAESVSIANTLKRRSFKNNVWNNDDDYQTFRVQSNKTGLLDKAIKNAEKRVEFIQKYALIHEKIARALDFKIKTYINFLDMLVTDYQVAQEIEATASIAKETLGDSGIKAETYQMAVDLIRDKTAESIGTVEALMRMAPTALMESDLQGDAFADKLLAQLNSLDQSTDTFFSETEAERKQLTADSPVAVIEMVKSKREEVFVPTRKYSILKK